MTTPATALSCASSRLSGRPASCEAHWPASGMTCIAPTALAGRPSAGSSPTRGSRRRGPGGGRRRTAGGGLDDRAHLRAARGRGGGQQPARAVGGRDGGGGVGAPGQARRPGIGAAETGRTTVRVRPGRSRYGARRPLALASEAWLTPRWVAIVESVSPLRTTYDVVVAGALGAAAGVAVGGGGGGPRRGSTRRGRGGPGGLEQAAARGQAVGRDDGARRRVRAAGDVPQRVAGADRVLLPAGRDGAGDGGGGGRGDGGDDGDGFAAVAGGWAGRRGHAGSFGSGRVGPTGWCDGWAVLDLTENATGVARRA